MLPTLFLAHGHPMNALEDNAWTRGWQALAAGIPRPEAILCVSAHWETPGPCLGGDAWPTTVHDFHGFPPALYARQYPCPGAPALAGAIARTLPGARVITGRGLDHGCWCVLAKLFPAADIPVLQLGLAQGQPAEWHWAAGEALQPWRERGVLVIGSGNIVHNLRRWFAADPDFRWAQAFDQCMADALQHADRDTLVGYERAPYAREAVPTPEHFLPLLYAAAAAHGEPVTQTDYPPDSLGNVCMRSVRFGNP